MALELEDAIAEVRRAEGRERIAEHLSERSPCGRGLLVELAAECLRELLLPAMELRQLPLQRGDVALMARDRLRAGAAEERDIRLADLLKDEVQEEPDFKCPSCEVSCTIRRLVVMGKALLDENPNPTEEAIREHYKGTLCRCTGYQKIIDAVDLS